MAHVCIHTGPHDSAVALVQNDKVMLIIEERLGHRKHACPPVQAVFDIRKWCKTCLLYTSPSPRDRTRSRMPSSA